MNVGTPPSLRRRLIVLLLSGTSAFWAILAAFSYYNAHHEVDELFDAQMAQVAHTLLAIAVADDDALEHEIAWPHRGGRQRHHGLHEPDRLMFQLRDASGHLLLRSPNAPDAALTQRDGFSEVRDRSGHWRFFSIRDDQGRYQVQIGEAHAVRDELITRTVLQFMLPILLGMPLLGFWVWHATGRGLAPVSDITRELALRGPDHLAGLPAGTVPVEIAPLVDTLNTLLSKVRSTLEAERGFTADAAHELRTPLAALTTQLQVAQRARDPAEREHALDQMKEGLTRTTRLVEQMLQLARLDPESNFPDTGLLDLTEVAREVCADLGPAAIAKDLDLNLEAGDGTRVSGHADWLGILVRNLLDNAIRYTPEGGRVTVSIRSAPDGTQLEVADSGPGIPPAQREAALRRFHRLDDTGQRGHGLGLSIVARIAELHRARLDLDRSDALHGLLVRVSFPPAA